MINKLLTQKFQEWNDKIYFKKRRNSERNKKRTGRNGKRNLDREQIFSPVNFLLVINDIYFCSIILSFIFIFFLLISWHTLRSIALFLCRWWLLFNFIPTCCHRGLWLYLFLFNILICCFDRHRRRLNCWISRFLRICWIRLMNRSSIFIFKHLQDSNKLTCFFADI